MNFDILVSVIIPVYNVTLYLEEAIESVICQNYSNLEIIIINDGSSDGAEDICEKYALKDKRIKLINQKNMGLSAARNVGLDAMTGEYVAFLDADDAYHPNFIKTLLDAILNHDVDLAMCKCRTYRTDNYMKYYADRREKDVPHILPGFYSKEDSLRALLEGDINPGIWNKLYKNYLWEKVRFPDGHVYEDVRTTYRILNLSKSTFVCGDSLYFHRKRAGSITETCSEKNISDWFLAYSFFDAFVQENTPSIFTVEMLESSRRSRLHSMIRFYGLCSGSKQYKRDLRSKVKESVRKLGTGDLLLKTKMEFYMICYCPWLLRLVYRTYYRIQKRT